MGLLGTLPFGTYNSIPNGSTCELGPNWNRTRGNGWSGSKWVRLHYVVFIRKRYRNVPFCPTVYTEPFSCPASNEDCHIRKYLNVYTMPFSYDNISIPFSYENGIV